MVIEHNIKVADQWFAAFNTGDIEALLSLYHNNAQHFSPKLKIRQPETNGLITGKEALRDWWTDAFNRLPDLKYLPTTVTADSFRVCMEYIRKVGSQPDMKIAEILEIKDGLIIASRVYHS